jgi:site-specific recombinase XerD
MVDSKPPVMFTLLFGDGAERAQRGASRRLNRWAAAFDDWLAELAAADKPGSLRHPLNAWRSLLGQQAKMPWELAQEDIEAHAAWLAGQGFSPGTITQGLRFIDRFYRWCGERKIDPACGAGFNPAGAVQRPRQRRLQGVRLLSREQVARLLAVMRRDPSELGKRDYAFTLARLSTGAPHEALRQLTWGQIEPQGQVAWVRWLPEAERRLLPQDAWEAIQAWLAASGRLAGMEPGAYVFVPLAHSLSSTPHDRPEAWNERRCFSSDRQTKNLKVYGRLAGVPAEILTQNVLRWTAIRLRLDEGASLEQMQAFLETRVSLWQTRDFLKQLPELPQDGASPAGEPAGVDGIAPDRSARRGKPGEGARHGFYARCHPPEAVAAVLAENIQGISEEIVGLRMLGRALLERQAQVRDPVQTVQLGEAYTLAAYRLGELIKAEVKLADQKRASLEDETLLERLDEMAGVLGLEPFSERARQERQAGLDPAARRVVEEVASTRLVLRNTINQAGQAHFTGAYQVGQLINLVDLYGIGCVRLVRLLSIEGAGAGWVGVQLHAATDQALEDLLVEWGRK